MSNPLVALPVLGSIQPLDSAVQSPGSTSLYHVFVVYVRRTLVVGNVVVPVLIYSFSENLKPNSQGQVPLEGHAVVGAEMKGREEGYRLGKLRIHGQDVAH